MAEEDQAPARGGGLSLRSPMVWVIGLGVALAGGALILWRRNQSQATAATAAPTVDTVDYRGQISTLQGEVADLQGNLSQDESAEGTGNPGPQPGGHPPAMPASVRVSTVTASSIRLTWSKVAGATSYRARVTSGKAASREVTISGTSATLTGLMPDKSYTAHVKACNTSGCSAETNGPVARTHKAGTQQHPGKENEAA